MWANLVMGSLLIATGVALSQDTGSTATVDRSEAEPGILGLLIDPAVQKELKLSKEQSNQLRSAFNKQMKLERELRASRRDKETDTEKGEVIKQLMKTRIESNAAARKLLDDKQSGRLEEIQRQVEGPAWFLSRSRATELSLTEDQVRKIREILAWFQQQNTELLRGRGTSSLADVSKKRKELMKERDEKILKELTPKQLERWQELKGPLFQR